MSREELLPRPVLVGGSVLRQLKASTIEVRRMKQAVSR